MRRQQREQDHEDEEPQAGWRENRGFEPDEDFGSPHDQGEHPSEQFGRGGQREERYRGGPNSAAEVVRNRTAVRVHREPYREGWSSDADYYGYRPEPRFERQYRETYRQVTTRAVRAGRSNSGEASRAGDASKAVGMIASAVGRNNVENPAGVIANRIIHPVVGRTTLRTGTWVSRRRISRV